MRFIIYLLGFVLAFIGSAQLYWGQYDNPIKQVFMIFYSVIKLFLFQPLVSFTNADNPIAYDLAIWLAPVGTAIGLFSVFDNLYHSVMLRFVHFNSKHLVVIGLNDLSMKFMNEAKKEYKVLLLAPHNLDQNKINQLNKYSILVVPFDFEQGTSYENQRLFKSYKIYDAISIISFEQEPLNYAHLGVISKLQEEYNHSLEVYVHHTDNELKEVLSRQMDQYDNLDVRYFNTMTMMAFKLFQDPNFNFYPNMEQLEFVDLTDRTSLTKGIGKVHLLLIGFGDLGQNIFRVASNQATINPYQNMELTIVDRKLNSRFEIFDSKIQHLERVADINLIHGELNSWQTINRLKELAPFTGVIFTLENAQDSLLAYERYHKTIGNEPVAIYSENMKELKPVMDAMQGRFDNLVFFGEISEVLNIHDLMNNKNYQKAKAFNAYYNRVLSSWMNWPQPTETVDEQWMKISTIKKESSLYQTMHQDVKKKILGNLIKNPQLPNSLNELVESFKMDLNHLSVSEQTNMIQNTELYSFLSALEHKRWNNFYYLQDFEYDEITSEANRTHNCLIDDWDDFFERRADKVIYDFLSWLSLEHEETR